MRLRIRSETMRDWRVLLLILVDLLALLVLFPRITRSTTVFSLTEMDSSQMIEAVLEREYSGVTHLFTIQKDGLLLHGYSFELAGPMEEESVENEVRSLLTGMIPRGMPPTVSVNATIARANITANERDVVITYIENGLDGKVTSLETLGETTTITLDRRVSRDELLELLGTSAKIEGFDNNIRTLKTNLKLGIDFLGGFYYNVRPVGVTFTARSFSTNVTPTLVSEFFNTSAVLKEEGERGILTIEVENPRLETVGNQTFPNASAILMEAMVEDFFAMHSSLQRVSFTFGNGTSELELNATNLNALRAVLNWTLSLRYDVVGGNELSGVFDVEGKGSEDSLTDLEANLTRYIEILDYKNKVTSGTMTEVEKMIQSRANFIGLADLRIKRAAGEYILVESPERIASGSSVLEPLDFEARIWKNENETIRVFTSEDVSRVDHYYFSPDARGWAVPLTLHRYAAENLREKADTYGAIDEDPEIRNEHRLGMYFNGIEVYNASFSEGLASSMKREAVVSILAITGGPRENEEARRRAEELWINLEASFPTKLVTAGEGQIPPILGKDFGRQVAAAAGAALVGVSLVVFLRYRRPKLVLAILTVSLSEVLIILGFAVGIGWYLDLSSVAGIIAVIGTGVDHQIVITDEALYQGEGRKRLVISTRISRAFFIIFTAAATTVIAMSPLAYVGLGRLRGFAIVTIVGVLSGVMISRPAYGRIVRRIIGGR